MFLKFFVLFCFLKYLNCEFIYHDLPVEKKDAPLVVETLITLEKISSFNLKELEYSMIFFQENFWTINRNQCEIYYLNSLRNYLKTNITTEDIQKYNINISHLKDLKIWVPNSYALDSKSITKLPSQNEIIEMVIDKNYCKFNLKTRLNVKVGCQMYFKNYPNDIQICPFRLASYTYPLESVFYKWKEPGLLTNRLHKQINQYTLSISKFQYNSTKYDDKIKYSYLEISLRFENHLSHYLMQIVFPSYFIVCIVYLNFWMKPDGSPGRFLLTILTFLSLVTIYNGNRDKLPALAYANAVDIWMLFNMFFVLCAICELVSTAFIFKREKKKEMFKKKSIPTNEIYIITQNENTERIRNDNMSNFMYNNYTNNDLQKSRDNLHSEIITVSSSNNLLTMSGKETPLNSTIHSSIENVLNNRIKRLSTIQNEVNGKKENKIDLDKIFRLWYPLTYLIFNLIYWTLLLNRWFDARIFDN